MQIIAYRGITHKQIDAPNFINADPAIRAAYLGAAWTGPMSGKIVPLKEI